MKKKLFLYLMLLLTFILPCISYAMSNDTVKDLQRSFKRLKQDFNLVIPGGSYLLPDASVEVQRFVRDELEEIGLSSKNIGVKLHKGFGGNACAPCNTIVLYTGLNSDILHIIKKLKTSNMSPEDQRKLNEVRGIIHHEGGHIKYNHTAERRLFILVSLALPFFWSKVCQFMPCLSFRPEIVLSALLLYLFTDLYLVIPWLSRMQEQQADDAILDDEEVLQAAYERFKLRSLLGLVMSDPTDIFSTHPADWKRATRFKERIDVLRERKLDEYLRRIQDRWHTE